VVAKRISGPPLLLTAEFNCFQEVTKDMAFTVKKLCVLMLLLFLISIFATCGNKTSKDSLELESGKKVKLLGKKRVKLDDDETALVLKYRTNHKLNTKAIDKEVNEIWDIFKEEVEEADLRYGIVTASTQSNDSASFMYEKTDNGGWTLVNKD
jgi:hypothetical protein